jgi:hypothetical protein
MVRSPKGCTTRQEFLELPRGRSFEGSGRDKDLQVQGPRTEHLFVFRNVTDLRDRRGASPKAKIAPLFPKRSKQAQTAEANGKETSSSETEASVPKNTVQTVQSPSPKIDRFRNGDRLGN